MSNQSKELNSQPIYICAFAGGGGVLRERVCLTLNDVKDLISEHPSVIVRKSYLGGLVSLKYAVDHGVSDGLFGVHLYDVHQVTDLPQKLVVVIDREIGSAK